MRKIIILIIVAGLAVVGVAAINTQVVDARQPTEFIQVSVLAEHQADYGVAEQVIAIPAVSADIIEDAALDFQSQSSVRIITYTPLPAKEPKRDREEGSDSVDETRHSNGQGTGNQPEKAGETGDNVDQGNNGNGTSNQNNGNDSGNNGNNGNGDKGNSGNGRTEDKNQDKDKGNGNSHGNGDGGGNGSGNGNGDGNNRNGNVNDGNNGSGNDG